MSLELCIGVATLAVFLWWLLTPSFSLKAKGNKIPGIPPWPIVGNAFHYHLAGTETIRELVETRKKYGRTWRLWLGPQLHVFITHPEDVQMLLTSHSMISKSKIYSVLDDWLGTGLLLSTGELWFQRRKAITPTFHFKVLDDFVPIFNHCAETLVNLLKNKVGKGMFNITPFVSNCALDSVAESAMGIKLEAQTKPKCEYVSALRHMTICLAKRANFPWLAIEPVYSLSGQKKTEESNLEVLRSVPKMVMYEKKNGRGTDLEEKEIDEYGSRKKRAFLDLLMKIRNENHGAFQSDQDIMDEVTTFMFEGHDTTTSALGFTLWLIGKHEEVQETLFKEVSAVLDNHNDLSIENVGGMDYLGRVIKESLRMFPPVPIIGRRLEKDIKLPNSGLTVPAGSDLYVGIYIMHRDPEFFPDPDTFNPDRFLEEQFHPFAYIPFSAGPRNCIGQKFAILDLKVVLAKMVYNFKIKAESELKLDSGLVLRCSDGPKVSLIKRNK